MMVRVGPFEATAANLDGNSLCCGLPSVLAALGFADAFARAAAKTPAPLAHVALIIHDCQISEGQIKPSQIHAGRGVMQNAEIPERVIGFVRASLILSDLPEIDETALRSALPWMRFCGAPIFPLQGASRIPLFVLSDRNPRSFFGGLPRGHALIARPDLAPPAFGSDEEIDRLCGVLAFYETDQPDETTVEPLTSAGPTEIAVPGAAKDQASSPSRASYRRRKEPGWLVPVPVGYRSLQPISTAQPRANSRDEDVPHIFAEDAAGLAEFVSIRQLDRATVLDCDPFWRWTVDREAGLFLAHPGFLQSRPLPPQSATFAVGAA